MPGIAMGTVRWCQGYSEPGAGSDLASLRTQAVDKGDHFLVNGQKIWTSGAQYADWCFCLVRTDNTRKHEGISFLLIDMKSPGVETRPIRLISGNSPFCETFFTDVQVPKENLMGPLNGGWTVGKRLLQFEREGQGGGSARRPRSAAPTCAASTRSRRPMSAATPPAALPMPICAPASPITRWTPAAMRLTVQRMQEDARANQGPSAVTLHHEERQCES